MEIIRKEDKIVIKDSSEIESYDFDSEINFKKLVNYLLKKNLSEKVDLNVCVDDLSEAEENLINLIKKIIDDYNDKVDEFETFKAENNED